MSVFDFKPPEDSKYAFDINPLCHDVMREFYGHVERHLVGAVEQIEGRMVSSDEVRQHAERKVWPDGREWFCWKGHTILEIPATPVKCDESGKLTMTIRSTFKEKQ